MNIKAILISGAAVLALGACGSAEEKEEQKPRPGMYAPSVELTELEMPGMTEDMKEAAKEQMKTQFAAQAGGNRCMGGGKETDWKEAANEMSAGLGGKCETTKDNGTATVADLEVSCTGTQLGDVVVSMAGEAQDESFDMDIMFDIKKLPTGGEGKMGMKLSASRVGDC